MKHARATIVVFISLFAMSHLTPTRVLAERIAICATDHEDRTPLMKLGAVPVIRLERQKPIGKWEAARINRLISRLARIKDPYFGLFPTAEDEYVAARMGYASFGTFVLTDYHVKPSETTVELIRTGSQALPFLLEHLDDQTPTLLSVTLGGGYARTWFANEIHGNSANAAERQALASEASGHKARDDHNPVSIPSYTVKVGDVCFVIIGQIVGRSYQVVHDQSSEATVLSSPTHDPAVARQVRAIWASKDPAQHLLDSLLIDYATEGVFSDVSMDDCRAGSDLQIGATKRLLYYFPRQSASLIAGRLRRLNVGLNGPDTGTVRDAGLPASTRRDVGNKVDTGRFIYAMARSKEPAIRAALRGIIARTTDHDLVLDFVSGRDPEYARLAFKRLVGDLDKLPESEIGPGGNADHELLELEWRAGDRARTVFSHFLHGGSARRCVTVCEVLRARRAKWALGLLAPLLGDKRSAETWTYAVVPHQWEPRLPIRVCDEAATTIRMYRPDLPFELTGTHIDLDRQIKAMREALRGRK